MSDPVVAVNMFRLRPGIAADRFARFSATVDQPTLSSYPDVVSQFQAYRVAEANGDVGLAVDIVEIMQVSDWPAWERLRDHDPALRPVTTGFDQLVDPSSVRSSLVLPILRGR